MFMFNVQLEHNRNGPKYPIYLIGSVQQRTDGGKEFSGMIMPFGSQQNYQIIVHMHILLTLTHSAHSFVASAAIALVRTLSLCMVHNFHVKSLIIQQ